MATPTLNTRVKLEGEKEFKEAIQSINGEMRNLDAELKLIDAQYDDNKDSLEALTKKSEVYQKMIDQDKEKVRLLTEQLEKERKANGENTAEYQKLEGQLIRANTSLAQHENQHRKITEAMNGESFTVADLAKKLGINLPEGAEKALKGVGDFSVAAVAAFAAVTAGIKLTIDAVNKLTDITKEAAGYVDDLNTTAVKSGIDTYTLQVLNYMEDLADVDVSTVTSSMTKLEQSMEKASEGTAEQQEAFIKLGISVTEADGTMREATDVFWEAIDALGEMESGTARDQLAMDLFGRSAKELNTLINVGSRGFHDYAAEAENVGYILSNKANNALQEYNDSLDRSSKMMEAMYHQMGAEMAPALQQLNEGWTKLVTEAMQLLIDSHILDVLSKIVEFIGWIAEGIGYVLEGIGKLLNPIKTINELFGDNNKELEQNVDLTTKVIKLNDAETKSIEQKNSAMKKLNRQYEITAEGTKVLTEESKKLVEALGGFYTNGGAYWYDSWGNRFSAEDDVASNFYEGYAQTIYTHIDENGNEYEVIGEDSRDTSPYWLAHGWVPQNRNASGDMNFVGGRTWVGENGPEVVDLPAGSRIHNAQDSMAGSGDNFYITANISSVKNLDTISKIMSSSRRMKRMRGVAI